MSSTLQEWIFGVTPAGFKRVSPDETQMILVRDELVSSFKRGDFRRAGEMSEASPFQGRGPLRFLRLDNGERALIRAYRHGGLFRHLTGDLFFTWPPRPFQELVMTEEARRRGVPTLEVAAACLQRAWGPFYRGWLITRELGDADDLWAALRGARYGGSLRAPLLRSVAASIKRMHQRGIAHHDLNLKNILVRAERDKIESYIIDFDKSRFFPGPVPGGRAERNLKRLHRSVWKLDPARTNFSADDWALFTRFYREAQG